VPSGDSTTRPIPAAGERLGRLWEARPPSRDGSPMGGTDKIRSWPRPISPRRPPGPAWAGATRADSRVEAGPVRSGTERIVGPEANRG
jgi:hypothetical protein